MADFQNAAYRLLSFKYTPPLAAKGQTASDDEVGRKAEIQPGDEDLPSLSSLLTSIQEIEGFVDAGTKNDSGIQLREECQEGRTSTARTKPLKKFHLFNDLPTEIRLKIWDLTFLPRVVEVRPPRPHNSQGQWQSGCSNPAALAVCIEAREAALAHFRIPFPLTIDTKIPPTGISRQNASEPLPFKPTASSYIGVPFNGTSSSGENGVQARRTLYVSPEHDTVCLLGRDWDNGRLSHVMRTFREADPLRVGISRLGMSVRAWGFGGSVVRMKELGTTLFQELDQLVLFMYGEQNPPPAWRAKGSAIVDGEDREQYRREGNRCELMPCEVPTAYRVWSGVHGRQFREDGKVLRIGRNSNEIRFMDLDFKAGW
ncbi:hypothetical protein N0V93_006511 [Gnomoniopsis smithogilvyi]|uniref:2EXR domain-containing protein n=1 Tax=Gnomoniopsis smithogilvyi TaxID=1191159 RepID=A0A9W8YPZ5_9PEZI|nr:hypothetical protein N0V93_006511 [Gnomoniopsis smithogilvyi]